MHQPFSNNAGRKLLAEIRSVFDEKDIFFSFQRHIVFVCGGTKRTSFRSRFLTYLKTHPVDLNTFLAEDAVDNLLTHNIPEFVNLAQFEDLMASIFDSVLIFPETPGSIAELGFFAKSEKLQKKILVANNIKWQGVSFINLGPVALIDSKSIYRPTIYLNNKSPDFDKIVRSLLRYQTKRIQRDRFTFNTYNKLDTRQKFAAVLQLIQICRGITMAGLLRALQFIFKGANDFEVRRFLSILDTAGFIQRVGSNNEHLIVRDNTPTLLEFEHVDMSTLSARALHYFRKYDHAAFDAATRPTK